MGTDDRVVFIAELVGDAAADDALAGFIEDDFMRFVDKAIALICIDVRDVHRKLVGD